VRCVIDASNLPLARKHLVVEEVWGCLLFASYLLLCWGLWLLKILLMDGMVFFFSN
jgi:hypothetical protein